jgi:ribose transport system substrate-binding protein
MNTRLRISHCPNKGNKHSPQAAISLALAAMLILAGCRSSEPHQISVIPPVTAWPIWEAEHAGAELAGKETGHRIYWNAPARADDIEGQIELVDRVIGDRTAGLVIVPNHSVALITPVMRAVHAGVPVVVVATPLAMPAGDKITYILNDDDESGRIAAERIGTLLNGKGTVAVLGIDPDITSTLNQLHSFEKNLAAQFPRIAIVERRAGWLNSAEAFQMAQETLNAHPELDAILGLTETATRGASEVLQERGSRVKLVGCRQELDLMRQVRAGRIDSIVAQNTYEMGYRAVHAIAMRTSSRPVPAETRIKPLLITRENYDTPEVQQLFHEWRP